ncbi:hypothetical protein K9M79_03265 [Candidatus Woesearchaeota archaeon]|nr:hypothetical protein [Candidatus Woesearchaeota archaeon]
MPNQKIEEYIKENIDKYPINAIRVQLLKAGYSIPEINEALADVEGINSTAVKEEEKLETEVKFFKKETLMLVVGLIIIAGAAAYFFNLSNQEVDCGIGTYNKDTRTCEFFAKEALLSCPGGAELGIDGESCEYIPTNVVCDIGSYNSDTDVCEYKPRVGILCEEGTEYNLDTDVCEYSPKTQKVCDLGYYNDYYDACVVTPSSKIFCDDNFDYNPDTNRCEYYPSDDIVCESPYHYNSEDDECQYEPSSEIICDIGSYNESTDNCEYHPQLNVICSLGTYNSTSDNCEYYPDSMAICEEGEYNSTTGKCEFYPEINIKCVHGEYNATTDSCQYYPDVFIDCFQGDYNDTTDLCVYYPEVDVICEKGTYNITLGVCEYTPETTINCETGAYNSSTDSCEYYPDESALCEKGSYDQETDTCRYYPEIGIECDVGEYNSTTDMCEFKPDLDVICEEGSYNSTTDKCEYRPESDYVCPEGSDYDSEAGFCIFEVEEVENICSVGEYDEELEKCVIYPEPYYVCENGELEEIDGGYKCIIPINDTKYPVITAFNVKETEEGLEVYVETEDSGGIEKLELEAPEVQVYDCKSAGTCSNTFYVNESGRINKTKVVPPVYVTFYSHNEVGGYWQNLLESESDYNIYRQDLVNKINLLKDYGVVLNWEADSVVLLAMQEWETGDASTNNKNILRWMVEDMGMVVDPHAAKDPEYTYADLAYMIEEFGIESSKVTGGYLVYECGDEPGELAQIDWKENIGIGSDGYIHGKKYPSNSWKPVIVAQAAMRGHVYDEFSSGVWKPSEEDFFVHDSDEDYIYVGEGYPHTIELVGETNSGGTTIWTSEAEYVKELVSMIESGELPADKIYTASVHVRDDPMTSTYDELEGVLESFSELHDAGKVVFLDYESVADIWEDEYDSEPNRVDISEFSFYENLMTEVCVDISSDECGDGICSDGEDCPEDCSGQEDKCGDGVCDGPENEVNCPADCASDPEGDPCDLNSDGEVDDKEEQMCDGDQPEGSCGDGSCDSPETEENCPADCASAPSDDSCDINSDGKIDDKEKQMCNGDLPPPGDKPGPPSNPDFDPRPPGPPGITGRAIADPGGKCGDGICDEFEQRNIGVCPEDCPESAVTQKQSEDCMKTCIELEGGSPTACSDECGIELPSNQPDICMKTCVELEGNRPFECFERCGIELPTIAEREIRFANRNIPSREPLESDGQAIYMKTSKGRDEIRVLPDSAERSAQYSVGKSNVKSTTLSERDGEAVYEVTANKNVRILSVVPAKMEVKAYVDAESSEVVETKKPIWGALATEEKTKVTVSVTNLQGFKTTETKECPEDCGDSPACGDGICSSAEDCPEDCGSDEEHYEDSPFGILGLSMDSDDLAFAEDLNVKWTRAHGQEGLKWDMVEKEGPLGNSDYDWTETDELIETFEEKGINVIWTINPYNAIDQGDDSIESRGNTKLPNNLDAYAKFLEAAVERYDYVKYWQVHNEINVDQFFWDDTSENYALLLKTSYDAIKKANPDAKVVIGGMSNPNGITEGNDYTTIMSELQDLGGTFDVFDVHWYGFVGNYKQHDKTKETLVHFMEESLPELLEGFDVEEVWMTEIGTHSGSNVVGNIRFADQNESDQAGELFKRYAYSSAHGISKLFWNKIIESASYSQQFNHNDYFDNLGLVHNGVEYIENKLEDNCPTNCISDSGKNVKKLSYYTLKLMTEKLKGSDWNNIETIQESNDVYVYKFTNKETNEPTWVAWSDSGSGSVSLSSLGISSAKVTEAVPDYENGLDIEDSGVAFEDMFKESVVSGSVQLGDVPVFIEESNNNMDISDYEDSPFGYLNSPELTTYYEDLGVKWTRVAAQWGLLQTSKNFEEDVYDWDYWEERVDWDKLKNMNVLITISFLGTPIEETGSYVPSQYPYNKENYLKYVEALVNRYKTQTKYFQVENEPPKDLDDFAELQKITYNKIKEVCPECIVVIGGYVGGASLERLFDRDMLPILSELDGKYIDIFDIHWFGTKHDSNVMDPSRFSSDKMDINLIREKLHDYGDIDIWITESGTHSGLPIGYDFQTEKEQASSVIKRYVSPIAQGVDKVMWAWGVKESFKKDCRFFDYTGLIYDGCDCEDEEYSCGNNIGNDLGKDVKKLGYYTYKKMTETLEGSDWDNIETVKENDYEVFVYKFTNKETKKSTWVAWSDSGSGSVSLSSLGISSAKIIEAVPDYENGLEIEEASVAFEDMFKESVVSGSIELDDVPVYIEESNNNLDISDYEDSPFGIATPYNDIKTASKNIEHLGIKWLRTKAVAYEEKDWEDPDWSKTDQVINMAVDDELNILLSHPTLFRKPGDWNDYEEFLAKFVNRYKDRVKYYQIGNELNGMWEGREKEELVNFLVYSHNTIKDNCPDCKVIFGVLNTQTYDYYSNCSNPRFCVQDLYPIIINHPEFRGQAFDALDFHWFGWKNEYKFLKYNSDVTVDLRQLVRDIKLDFNTYGFDADLWIVEAATHSGQPAEEGQPFQSEKHQAIDLVKRYIYPISLGVKKIFWVTLTEWHTYAGRPNCYFDNVGLINNPCNDDYDDHLCDGFSHKKLSYYSYKLMVEKLEDSDWDNIEIIQESNDIYIYKFTDKETNEPTWVAWSDSGSGSVSLSSLGITSAKVTETVPDYENGLEIEEGGVAFEDMFEESIVSGSVQLEDIPVFIEESNNNLDISDYEDSPFGFIQGEHDELKEFNFKLLNDLGVSWNKYGPMDAYYRQSYYGTPDDITIEFGNYPEFLQQFEDNDINTFIAISPRIFLQELSEDVNLEPEQYGKLCKDYAESFDGDGVDDVEGSLIIKNWFTGITEMNKDQHTEHFSAEEMADLIKECYDSIKEEIPDANIFAGSSEGVATWSAELKPDETYFFDFVSHLTGDNFCPDINFDYHQASSPDDYKSQAEFIGVVRDTLDANGYQDSEIWTTDVGGTWDEYDGFTEIDQSGDVFRRQVSALANGQDKFFWTRIVEYIWGESSIFSYMGLIHNPVNDKDKPVQKNWKKISYYSYKLLIDKLNQADWNNIEILKEDDGEIFAYKLKRDNSHAYVIWWDYYSDSNYIEGDVKSVSLNDLGLSGNFVITKTIPHFENGLELRDSNEIYPSFFDIENTNDIISLGKAPVIIERYSDYFSIPIESSSCAGQGGYFCLSDCSYFFDATDTNYCCQNQCSQDSVNSNCDLNGDGIVDDKEMELCEEDEMVENSDDNSYDADGFLWGTEGTSVGEYSESAINNIFKTKYVKKRYFGQSFTNDWKSFDTNYGIPSYDSENKNDLNDALSIFEENNWSMIPMLSYGKPEDGYDVDSDEAVEQYTDFVMWFLSVSVDKANIEYIELQNVPIGEPEYFVKAQNSIYDAVKAEYPEIMVGTPGFEYWEDPSLPMFTNMIEYYLDKENEAKFDFWAFHDYGLKTMDRENNRVIQYPPTLTADYNQYAGIPGIKVIRKMLDANGWEDRLMIDTEHAGIAYPRSAKGGMEISQEEDKINAAYMLQSLLLKKTLTLDGVPVLDGAMPYKMSPWETIGEFNYGVLGSDGSATITVEATGVLWDYMDEYNYNSHVSGDFDSEEVWVEKFVSDEKELYIFFDPFSETAEEDLVFDSETQEYELDLGTTPTSITLIDVYGNYENFDLNDVITIDAENMPQFLVVE